jgi:hypothetical protein
MEVRWVRVLTSETASRKGGIRVELEKWSNGVPVVHNYGHAGAGYQSSWYVLLTYFTF